MVHTLEDAESKQAVPLLVYVVKNDQDMDVRKAAIRVLGEIGTPEARSALMEILGINGKE